MIKILVPSAFCKSFAELLVELGVDVYSGDENKVLTIKDDFIVFKVMQDDMNLLELGITGDWGFFRAENDDRYFAMKKHQSFFVATSR